jgi:hypothetical protein
MKTLIAVIVTALVVSATATAGALVVTSKNIKNGTIQTVDISKKARLALKGNRGPRGLQGPQGPPGVAGAQGIQGIQGAAGANGLNGGLDPSKVSYVAGAPVEVLPGTDGQAVALYAELDDAFDILVNAPFADGSGWNVETVNGSTGSSFLQAYAVCVRP